MTAAIAAAHPPTERAAARGAAAVRLWLWILAALVVAMVAVGGATRLTGSGLSITEWKPVTGAVPPLSAEAWAAEFERYRQTPQYELLNRGMSLAEFKAIYAWEWGHRQLGRLIGLAFFVPLAWFWFRGAVSARLSVALLGLGALGGLQAAVGWIMVASGLEPGMVAVAPVKLTLHLLLASAILAGLVWIATGLSVRRDATAERLAANGAVRSAPAALLALVFLQIALGGLVAGSKAGWTYNTWPLMDGALVPPVSALFAGATWAENLFGNVALIQWNHRLGAYLLVGFAVWQALALRRSLPGAPATRRAGVLAGLVLAQAALGVVTLVLVVPLWAGLAHQVLAMAVLAMAVVHLRLSRAPAYTDRTAPPSTRTRLPVT
jgi:cytochrome c oxidase assembly protein subunit 15